MNKKTLLFISPRAPYPLLSGEKNKTFNEIKILSKKYEIIFCSLCPARDFNNVKELLKPYCKEVVLFKASIIKSLMGTLIALITNNPLQIGYFRSSKMRKYVFEKSKEYDGVFVNLFRAFPCVEGIRKPLYLDMSDSISEHYKNAVKVTSSYLWKLIYFIEYKKMRKYEVENLPHFLKVFSFNPAEIQIYKSSNLKWIPLGVNDKILEYVPNNKSINNYKISFLGKMDYRPNIEAVKWFAKNVMPKLPQYFTFQIIGAYPTPEVKDLATDPRIEVTGFVDDPYKLLSESVCVVAPMISGGGIQTKLLESMAIGCVNLASPLCANSLVNLKDEIILYKDADDLARKINALDTESNHYKEIQVKAREYIRNNYTWAKFEEILFKEVDL